MLPPRRRNSLIRNTSKRSGTPFARSRVVSRNRWKFVDGHLRMLAGYAGSGGGSRDIGSIDRTRVRHPSTFRIRIRPERRPRERRKGLPAGLRRRNPPSAPATGATGLVKGRTRGALARASRFPRRGSESGWRPDQDTAAIPPPHAEHHARNRRERSGNRSRPVLARWGGFEPPTP